MNYTTGTLGFGQRQLVANSDAGKPIDAKQPVELRYASKNLYTPALCKIDGYQQFPRPVEKPYANKVEYTSECKTREFLPKQRYTTTMFRRATVAGEPSKTFESPQRGANEGLFLYHSMKNPERVKEPKVLRDLLSATANHFRKAHGQSVSVQGGTAKPTRTHFNATRNNSLLSVDAHKEAVIKAFESHSSYFEPDSDYGELKIAQKRGKSTVGGVSRRFNDRMNLDEQSSFLYVGPTATQAEKLLQARAHLINNKPGLKLNGLEL